MEDKRIGVGVIGIGLRGQHSYEQVLRNDPRVEVRAVSSYPNVNSALAEGQTHESYAEYAHDLGAEYLGEDYQALLGRDDVQLVSLMCQPDRALDLGKACIDAGKAFLRDKPVAKTADDAWRLAELVKQAGVFAGLAMPLRYNRPLRHVVERIRSDSLGDVIAASMSYIWPTGPLEGFTASKGYLDAYGGGDVTTAGFHAIDYINWLIGAQPLEAICQMDSFFYDDYKALGMDDLGQIVICYSNGAVATLITGRVPSRSAGQGWLDVTAARGALEVRDFSSAVRVEGPSGVSLQRLAGSPLDDLSADYLDSFERGQAPPAPIADGAVVLAVLEAARRSASSGLAEEVVIPFDAEVAR